MDHALELLDQVLKLEPPANLDLGSVTVTGEGPAEGIVLIPHRDLGGYSLTMWFSDESMDIGWASVIDLEYHDELDLGKVVTGLKGPGWGGDEILRSAIRSELQRPIRVQLERTRFFRRWRLRCAVEESGRWYETRVCLVPKPATATSGRLIDVGVTSLTGPGRPAVHCPVPVDRWHRFAEPAWPRQPAS